MRAHLWTGEICVKRLLESRMLIKRLQDLVLIDAIYELVVFAMLQQRAMCLFIQTMNISSLSSINPLVQDKMCRQMIDYKL